MTRTWSPYQLAVFDAIEHTTDNLVINAVAGSGKTTVIEESSKRLTSTGTSTIVMGRNIIKSPTQKIYAFNKSIATELQARSLPGVTFHSEGFACLRAAGFTHPKINQWKVKDIFQSIVDERLHDDYAELPRLISIAKGIASNTPPFADIIENHDLDFPSNDKAAEFATRILAISNEQHDVIDFDDMLYLPWLLDLSFPKCSVVFVDEAQDTNSIQRELLRSTGARVIAVGDRRQAIYGFRGAGTNSIDIFIDEFHAREFPLSISYRCAKRIVRHAQHIAPEIESHTTAPDGIVDTLDTWDSNTLARGSAILCRNTRPLIPLAYSLIAAGVPCNIHGRDIGKSFINIIKRWAKSAQATPLLKWLAVTGECETTAKDRRGNIAKAAAIRDRFDSLAAIVSRYDTGTSTTTIINDITALFSDTALRNGITLSTVHKAKGLEWDVVYILDPQLMPSKYATKGWQLDQEHNIMYVAYTRARRELYFIKTPRDAT